MARGEAPRYCQRYIITSDILSIRTCVVSADRKSGRCFVSVDGRSRRRNLKYVLEGEAIICFYCHEPKNRVISDGVREVVAREL